MSTNGENGFELLSANLEIICNKIPHGTRVSIVSVVGAFRTGKSFLLTFFLRYLRNYVVSGRNQWMTEDGELYHI